MKITMAFLGVILVTILVLALGGGILVLSAYGIGWVVNLLMGLESFQATALGLAGIFVFIILVDRGINALTPLSRPDLDDFEYDDDDNDEENDGYEVVEDEEARQAGAGALVKAVG